MGVEATGSAERDGSQAGTVRASRAELGFRHDALFFDSAEDLAAVAAPFLLEGLAAGDGAVIAAGAKASAALCDAVGNDPLVLGARATRPLPRSDAHGDHHIPRTGRAGRAGRRVRVVGEVDFDATAADWSEWQRHEAVINSAFAFAPLWGMCVFSTDLPEPLLTTARHTHPHLVSRAGRAASGDYVDPVIYLAGLPVPDEPLERTPPALAADDVHDFIGLRRTIRTHPRSVVGPDDVLEDFQLAVDEMTPNAVRHGHQPVSLRLWDRTRNAGVHDHRRRRRAERPFAGYGPAHGDDLSAGRMGLWLARQLCDQVALRREPGWSTPGTDDAESCPTFPLDPGGATMGRGDHFVRLRGRRLVPRAPVRPSSPAPP